MIFSTEFENKIIDALFRGVTLNLETSSLHVGLIKPDNTEVSAPSYLRSEVNLSLTAWLSTQGNASISTGSSGKTSNTNAIAFPEALENWGLVNKLRFFIASTGSQYYFDLSIDPINIAIGNELIFSPGDLEISIRGE